MTVSPVINPPQRMGISDLSYPFELPDMRAAVERIKAALLGNEKVLVHGDYDTDGLTAAAIMVQVLRKIGLDVSYFIPNRMTNGYGFNPAAVHVAKDLGIKLIITVDCGISSFDAAAAAKGEGIDVIITDHHEPILFSGLEATSHKGADPGPVELLSQSLARFQVPSAVAVVNPKLRPGSGTSILSGAGIAFKFAQALAMDEGLCFSKDDCLPLLDLAALGTIADVVPLTGENRVIIKKGMEYINNAVSKSFRRTPV